MTFRSLRLAAATVAIAALAACATGPREDAGRLGFMVGCWQSKPDADGRVNKEVWSAPQGGIMFGWATATRGGELVSFEQSRIDVRGARATYTASPEGQRPVVFTEAAPDPLALAPPNSVRFENPDHDYPQRIFYRADGGDLVATISRIDGSRPGEYAWERCE
jgi:hypothetical protein